MKITEIESGKATARQADPSARILPEGYAAEKTARREGRRPKTSREEAIEAAREAISNTPDIREDIVNELKAKIESGQYNVSGADIADMMIRRMKADSIR